MLGFKAKSRHDEDEDKDQDKDTVSADVVKVIEIIGTSDQGFEEAIAVAIKTAASSLRHITGADVKHMTVAVKNG